MPTILVPFFYSYQCSNTVEVEDFFVTEKIFCFEWIMIIVAVPGVLRNTMEPQPKHWTNPSSNLMTISPKMSILHSFVDAVYFTCHGFMTCKILYFAYYSIQHFLF